MELFERYKYPIIGGALGLLVATLLITLGFFKTLLVLIFVIIGAYSGLWLTKTGLIDRFLRK